MSETGNTDGKELEGLVAAAERNQQLFNKSDKKQDVTRREELDALFQSDEDRAQDGAEHDIALRISELEKTAAALEGDLKYQPDNTKTQKTLRLVTDTQNQLQAEMEQNDATKGIVISGKSILRAIVEKIDNILVKGVRSMTAPLNEPLERLRRLNVESLKAQRKAEGKPIGMLRGTFYAAKDFMKSPRDLADDIMARRENKTTADVGSNLNQHEQEKKAA